MTSDLTLSLAAADLSPRRLPPVPWRDPHSVQPEELGQYIRVLEQACLDNPRSAGLRTVLGMAHAMNFDVYKSADALEEALRLEPEHFFAQVKYGELWYRLRALHKAEEETKKALDLAGDGFELTLARKQLQEIRRLKREGTQKPEWVKPLTFPAIVFAAMFVLLWVAMLWK
jgi:tetratricopeptide (TPR) repeat protein